MKYFIFPALSLSAFFLFSIVVQAADFQLEDTQIECLKGLGQKPEHVSNEPESQLINKNHLFSGSFEDILGLLDEKHVPIETIRELEGVKLPSHNRIFGKMDRIAAEELELVEIGAIAKGETLDGQPVQFQLLAQNDQEALLVAQRDDDIFSGIFSANAVERQDDPLNDAVLLGEGGQGKIYSKNNLAFKTGNDTRNLLPKLLKMQRFEGVVKLKGMFRTPDGELILIMEQLNKKDLGDLPASEFSWVIEQLENTLTELKSEGFTHGDISPANIMFRGDIPVFIDMGTGKKTKGYSDEGDDELALARSLISLRIEAEANEEFVEIVGEIRKVLLKLAHECLNNEDTKRYFKTSERVMGLLWNSYINTPAFPRAGHVFSQFSEYEQKPWDFAQPKRHGTETAVTAEFMGIRHKLFLELLEMSDEDFLELWPKLEGISKDYLLYVPDAERLNTLFKEQNLLKIVNALKILAADILSYTATQPSSEAPRHKYFEELVWTRAAKSDPALIRLIEIVRNKSKE